MGLQRESHKIWNYKVVAQEVIGVDFKGYEAKVSRRAVEDFFLVNSSPAKRFVRNSRRGLLLKPKRSRFPGKKKR